MATSALAPNLGKFTVMQFVTPTLRLTPEAARELQLAQLLLAKVEDAIPASIVGVTPAGNVSALNVQDALEDFDAALSSLSVVSANGFGGSVATPGTNPAITLTTSLTGLLKGDGTGLQVAEPDTDYVPPGGNIGAASGASLAVTGALTSSGGPVGYATGAGGTITQATSKSTTVTLDKLCGQIVMNGASLAAATQVAFTLNNSFLVGGELMILNIVGGSVNVGSYGLNAVCVPGLATITMRNNAAAALAEAVVLRFGIIKAVTA